MGDTEWNELYKQFMELECISGVLELSFGRNVTLGRCMGYTHALRVKFRCMDDIHTYSVHQLHQAFIKKLPLDKGDLPPVVCLDWE